MAAGFSARQIEHRLLRGSWVAVRRGVYAGGWVPSSRRQALLAVCLAAGDPCWLSHRTAASLWGLRVPDADAVEILTLCNRRLRLPGVVAHRTVSVPLADLTSSEGLPCTTVARTLVDCTPFVASAHLGIVVDDALRRKLLDRDELAACFARLDRGPARRLRLPMRYVLAARPAGCRPGGSQREVDVAAVLHRAGILVPVSQHPIVVEGKQRYLDYAWPELRVGLEWDGFAEHGMIRSTFDDDRLRGNGLALMGWLVLHATSRTPDHDLVRQVRDALTLRRAA